ncbi:MAG: argininosuccinate lyase [Acidobacteriota bacterium]
MVQTLRKAFTKLVDERILKYVASIEDDKYLLACDVQGSLAHVAMLKKIGIISATQAAKIKQGLKKILDTGLDLKLEYEDVHMNVEKRLEELIGIDAKLLHTARSRNDQVALDLRLFVAEQQKKLRIALGELCQALVTKAEKHLDVLMPGYTHLQHAQVVLFSHVLLSFREALRRDIDRLTTKLVSPMGACALAGTAIPIDPMFTAAQLGAQSVFTNSIDAVSDRDFAAEFLFAGSLVAVHLSQLAENLILWCTEEFSFIKLPDELTTGSSIMPQKKNPDCLELVRGRTGQAIGELVNLLVTLKALPLGYNRDLQETKPPVIRVSKTLLDSIMVCTMAITKMSVNKETMLKATSDEFLFATDIVEHLVTQGLPFRDAHSKVAEIVKFGKKFSQLTIAEWKKFGIDPSIVKLLNSAKSVAARKSYGGTAPQQVKVQLKEKKK